MSTLRLIRKDDVDENYIKFLKEININFSYNNIKNIIENNFIEIWVIDDDNLNRIIGSATLYIENRINNIFNIAHIKDIIIDKNIKNNDYYNIIVEHLIERAKVRNCYKIILDCNESEESKYEKYFIKKGINMSLNI